MCPSGCDKGKGLFHGDGAGRLGSAWELLELLALAPYPQEIAEQMAISPRTVNACLRRIRDKLELKNSRSMREFACSVLA
jgi:hypothetical protein